MKIVMSYEGYNKMQDFAKCFAAKAGNRNPALECIKLTVIGGMAKAEALDGYKAGYIMIPLADSDADGIMILPVTGKPKKQDAFADIVESGREIEVKTATGVRIHRMPEDEFLNTSEIYPEDEAKETFAFDPKLLSEALKAFSGEKKVKIEYRGALRPLIIKSNTGQALVLPMRV